MTIESETKDWYKEYYKKRGVLRNDLFNPEVLFQDMAYTRAWIDAFRGIDKQAKILDVGGGGGAGLLRAIKAGFLPERLHLIDVIKEDVEYARKRLPNDVHVQHGDAADMSYFDSSEFDVVTSSGMFIQLLDKVLAEKIAGEMIRVTKNKGILLVFDCVYDFWRSEYRAVDYSRIHTLFCNNQTDVRVVKRIKGQLIPPIGRFLSKYLPSMYFIVQKIPLLTWQYCYVLKKSE